MSRAASVAQRRFFAPEVVQTSIMDCGPAALKSVLEGFRIPVSYGRLREACQTDVDGSSIDAIETVAQQAGLQAEQVLIPLDHLCLPEAAALPAIAVVRRSDGATHFVVVWRRIGRRLQVMDPATGRRWVDADAFADEIYRHETDVAEPAWRAWAGSDDFCAPLARRLRQIGASGAAARALIERARRDPGWFSLAALDAALRLAQSVVDGEGLAAGRDALALVERLVGDTQTHADDIFRTIPAAYWSALPDARSAVRGELRLTIRGMVLVRLGGAFDADRVAAGVDRALAPTIATLPPSREVTAALAEKPVHPLATVWRLLREEGLLAPLALVGAMGVAAGALLVETLLFRGLFDIAAQLGLASQRVAAVVALLGFVVLLLAIETPIVLESLRFGRHLEMRLRVALLSKLPRLADRYFQSRPVSDMAERSHSLAAARLVPSLALNVVQSGAELALTLLAMALIDPACLRYAGAIALIALVLPFVWQPLLAERDLRVRNHGAALNVFFLDALLGLVPVRAHRGETAVRQQHEGLLVQWVRAARGLIAASQATVGLQSLLCTALAGGLLIDHFQRAGGVTGADLLLVYWALKLPAIGGTISGLLLQLTTQRNVLARLIEPLNAPEQPVTPAALAAPAVASAVRRGAAIHIEGGRVVAAGHEILRDVDLRIAPGEQVAIVGASGAGKSTLLGLLLGWHRLAEGRLSVDGEALDNAAQDALRRATAWVDPGVQLWNRSFIDNLGYASPELALERVGAAIDAARLRDVLRKLPEGLQTPLGEGGALLSGGEGQRVRFARALLQDGVRLALLDEPFRGLDREQRATLLAEARRWWQGATLLCVTHDVGETRQFDRVLVVDDGRIVEDGPPAELAARADSRYAALLDVERELKSRLWQGTQWRRVRVEGGRVQPGVPDAAMAALLRRSTERAQATTRHESETP